MWHIVVSGIHFIKGGKSGSRGDLNDLGKTPDDPDVDVEGPWAADVVAVRVEDVALIPEDAAVERLVTPTGTAAQGFIPTPGHGEVLGQWLYNNPAAVTRVPDRLHTGQDPVTPPPWLEGDCEEDDNGLLISVTADTAAKIHTREYDVYRA